MNDTQALVYVRQTGSNIKKIRREFKESGVWDTKRIKATLVCVSRLLSEVEK